MIRARELRIGNLFIAHDGKVFKWDISLFGLLDQGVGLDKIIKEPIGLTDEFLVEFGFEAFPWGWIKKSSNDFGVRINLRSYNYEVSGNSPVKIQFVHQLQNLFFVLTGEELIVVNVI